MQWLINEFKDFKKEVSEKIESGIAKYVANQVSAADRITKLEGEIKAMKARAGKKIE